jgi:phosphate transport system substrate-binding protein
MSQHTLKSKSLGGTAAAVMLAAAFSAAGTAPAQAQTTGLYSGGGTFAEKVYRDIMNCYGNHDGTDLTTGLNPPSATCNAAAPYRSNVELHYVGSGSGRGLLSFTLGDTQQFNIGRVPDAVPVPSSGSFGPFYGTGTGSTWARADSNGTGGTNKFPRLSFAGSDDPLSTGNLATYDGNKSAKGWGNALQVPALIGAVAVPFSPTADGFTEKGKKPAGGNNASPTTAYSSLVDFSTNTMCGIFTGDIKDWSDHRIKADNSNVALVPGAVDGNTHPITVIYRSDSSGTTFLFTNGLVNQCAETATPVPASWQTAVNGAAHNTAGKGDNSWYINVAAAGLFPAGSHFVAAPGSGGVQAAIPANAGSVGYISTDFVLPIDTAHNIKAANLQTYASLHNGTPAVFRAPNSKNGVQIVGSAKSPLNKAASCPVGSALGQSPDGNCAHNPLNWGVTFPKPLSASAYPIGGFTFIDTYTCYANAADVNALVGTTAGGLGYLRWYYGSVTENSSLVKNALAANGFSPVPGSWMGAVKKLLTTDKVTKIAQAGTGTVKTNPTCFDKVGGA